MARPGSSFETNDVASTARWPMTRCAAASFVSADGTVWNGQTTRGLDGATWKLVAEHGLPPRNHMALAWDPTRRALVLFGGHDGTLVFGDAWEWNGQSWREVRHVDARPRIENGH